MKSWFAVVAVSTMLIWAGCAEFPRPDANRVEGLLGPLVYPSLLDQVPDRFEEPDVLLAELFADLLDSDAEQRARAARRTRYDRLRLDIEVLGIPGHVVVGRGRVPGQRVEHPVVVPVGGSWHS